MSVVSAQADLAFAWLSLHRERLRRIGLLAALGLFAGGLYLSLRANPDILSQLRLGPILVLFFVMHPLVMVISAVDFQVLARLPGVSFRFWPAVQVTLYSRAANMLPIPGSLAVRMAALKGYGATFRRGGGLILLLTAIWGGIGFCFSAAWLTTQAPAGLTIAFASIGVAIIAASALIAYRMSLPWPLLSGAALLRLVLIAVEALMLTLAMWAVGTNAGYQQTAILVVASFLSSIVPAGIGVRESLIAVLSPIAGVDPSIGFLAATAGRVTGMSFLAVSSITAFMIEFRANRSA